MLYMKSVFRLSRLHHVGNNKRIQRMQGRKIHVDALTVKHFANGNEYDSEKKHEWHSGMGTLKLIIHKGRTSKDLNNERILDTEWRAPEWNKAE